MTGTFPATYGEPVAPPRHRKTEEDRALEWLRKRQQQERAEDDERLRRLERAVMSKRMWAVIWADPAIKLLALATTRMRLEFLAMAEEANAED